MSGYNNDKTITFSIKNDKDSESRRILQSVYSALLENGYDPVVQIVGYILSEDPTYITNYKNARSLIRKIDRYDLLDLLVRNYFGIQ